jgi:hypothetical protein
MVARTDKDRSPTPAPVHDVDAALGRARSYDCVGALCAPEDDRRPV